TATGATGRALQIENSLLQHFEYPAYPAEVVETQDYRVGGLIEHIERMLDAGVLRRHRSRAATLINMPLPRITPEMIDDASRPEEPLINDDPIATVSPIGEVERLLKAGGGFVVASSDTQRRDTMRMRVEDIAAPGEAVVGIDAADVQGVLKYPEMPVIIDGEQNPDQALGLLRQVMLLSPRPAVWLYRRGDGEAK